MSDKLVDRRNLDFLLFELLDIAKITESDYYRDHSRETFQMALDTAYQVAREVFWPSYQTFDRNPAHFDGQKTIVPEPMHAIWKEAGEGGWFAVTMPYEQGGQQFPSVIQLATALMFNAANTSAEMYIGLTSGAGGLIASFGSDKLKELFMTRLFSGEWAGTMALTEPQAGSSLSDIKTTAVKATGGDYYYIAGTKRFISGGDNNLTPNIIHPTLAKIEGAPDGVRGISLFVVPKVWVNDDGSLGEPNDVLTAGIEHKLGLKGQATAELKFGENGKCRGYLLGEPHKGLSYMFQLMNQARIHTGVQAIAQASAAYFCSLQYAHEREQGREMGGHAPSDPKTAGKDQRAAGRGSSANPQIPIIRHAAVRRMLVTQKAYVEGVTALLLFTGYLADQHKVAKDPEIKKNLQGVMELLTPVCKAYGSEIAYKSIDLAVQCYGGSGFIEEFPVAQMLRDNRVFSIYEGTNQIQAMDLLGRKVARDGGADFRALMGEIGKTLEAAKPFESLNGMRQKVEAAMMKTAQVTLHLGQIGMSGDVSQYLSYASQYLEMFSPLTVSWLFLWQCIAAEKALAAGAGEHENFYLGKLATAKHYINTVLPMAHTMADEILANERTAFDFKEEWFPPTA